MLTLAWVIALNNTLLPVITFVVDVYGFCKRLSAPELTLLAVYGAFCVLCSALGAQWFDVTNLYHFYHVPLHTVWKLYGIGLGVAFCYLFIFHVAITAWDKYG